MATQTPKNINNDPDVASTIESTEDIDQIGKDIIVGHKEVGYEDGKNVISVIINAISVRINMPRGTVKALMACLAMLVIIALFYGISLLPSKEADEKTAENETEQSEEKTEDDTGTATDNTPSGVLSLKDYVNISPHYYYHLPENVEDVWTPDEMYAENETLCNFLYNGNLYTIRSFILDWYDADLEDIVESDLKQFEGTTILDEEYVSGKYGKMLKVRFESEDEDGNPIVGTGYYWYESDPKICCLEVTTDVWRDDGPEEMVKDSVYRVSAGTTPPYEVDDLDYQKDEAMKSLIEEGVNDYYQPEPETGDFPL